MLILVVLILGIGGGLVFWKTSAGGHHSDGLTHVSKEDMEIFLETAINPMQLRMLAQSAEQRKELAKNLRELLAIASQARKDGYAEDPETKVAIARLKKELLALNYDKEINGKKGQLPPFSFIKEDQVKAFWEETEEEKSGFLSLWKGATKRRYIKEFETLYDDQIKVARERGLLPKEGEDPTEEQTKQITEQRKQMRTQFAKLNIYHDEAKEKLASISSMSAEDKEKWEKFERKTELQIQLQIAQLLVQKYVQKELQSKLEVKKEEVDKYIAEHPELGKEKREKAEGILKKIKDGEDFAKLAKEFSEDPGSKDKGGLYENIPLGQMTPDFEKAALALKPGEVADKLIPTSFGYHIIKLEKKGETKGEDGKTTTTYDARHILISSKIKDPDNPVGQEMPLEAFVNQKLTKEKQIKILAEITEANPIEVAEDYEVKVPPPPAPMPQLPTAPGSEGKTVPPTPPSEVNESPESPPKKK